MSRNGKQVEKSRNLTIVRTNCNEGNKLMAYIHTIVSHFPSHAEAERVILEL